jgi:nitronate monooxygenase
VKLLRGIFLRGKMIGGVTLKLPELKIGNKIARLPIQQGGMAIRLSTARLAAAVANEGGIGLIAASGMSHDELRYEIRLARSLTSGIIGINIMVAARDFAGIVKTAIDEGIDLVVAGAGFSRDMFGLGKESGTPIVPIVSSVKLAKISERLGAAAIVLEGKEAGGHLGTNTSVRDLISDVSAAVKIPVIAAGGVLHGQDIVDLIKMGAAGVQMGSLCCLGGIQRSAGPQRILSEIEAGRHRRHPQPGRPARPRRAHAVLGKGPRGSCAAEDVRCMPQGLQA